MIYFVHFIGGRTGRKVHRIYSIWVVKVFFFLIVDVKITFRFPLICLYKINWSDVCGIFNKDKVKESIN